MGRSGSGEVSKRPQKYGDQAKTKQLHVIIVGHVTNCPWSGSCQNRVVCRSCRFQSRQVGQALLELVANAGDCVSADNDIAHTEPATEVQPEEAAATADQQWASLCREE